MTDVTRYPAQVFWSEDDKGFIAVAPDLPGCSAIGETQEEALRELHEAIAGWIDAARSVGNPVPAPSSPINEYSGKVLLRMPRSLHAKLAVTAKQEGVSLNTYVVQLLSGEHARATALTTATTVDSQRHSVATTVSTRVSTIAANLHRIDLADVVLFAEPHASEHSMVSASGDFWSTPGTHVVFRNERKVRNEHR